MAAKLEGVRENRSGARGSKELARTTLSQQLSDELIETIVVAGLRPNDKLPSEAALAERFGVSRPIVREALRGLSALGLIATSSGKQAVVARVDPGLVSLFFRWAVYSEGATLSHVLEVRRGLEVQVAQLAAAQRTSEDIAELDRVVSGMRAALERGDVSRHLELDLQFHMALARAARNPLLEYLLSSLREVAAATIQEAQQYADRVQTETDQDTHEAVFKAVRRGSVDVARRAMAKHFDDALARATAEQAVTRQVGGDAALAVGQAMAPLRGRWAASSASDVALP